MSELGMTENLVLTLTSANDFAGTVTVTPKLMDGTTEVMGWVTASAPTIDLTAGGTATVMLAVKIPTDAASLGPTLKIEATSSAAPALAESAFAIANKYTIVIPANTGTGTHTGLPGINTTLRLRMGAQIVFHNADGITHVIHGDGGIPHENIQNGGGAGTDYTVTPDGNATWYCHSHEGSNQARPVAVAP